MTKVKRIFDLFLSILILFVLSPCLLILAGMVWFNLGSPIIFCQMRPGLQGIPFRMLKFRTMMDKRDKEGRQLPDGERLAPLGRLLRKTSMDELPGLFNVIKGDMSLVGPRPEVESEAKKYGPEWNIIFSVRPGITDLSSIEFRNEGEIIAKSGIYDAHEAYRKLIKPRKLQLQKEYALGRSFLGDLKIILRTIKAVFDGA